MPSKANKRIKRNVQPARKSPLQLVRERFGSKQALAEALTSRLERPSEEMDDETFARLVRTMSNKKLLRLKDTLDRVESQFGGKEGLIDAIVQLRHPTGKPDLQYRGMLERSRVTRLLDLHTTLSKRA